MAKRQKSERKLCVCADPAGCQVRIPGYICKAKTYCSCGNAAPLDARYDRICDECRRKLPHKTRQAGG